MGVNLCFIARVADGMLLVASTDPMRSSDSQETMDVYKSQAKQILAGLTERSPSKCSIDSGPFAFHYVISDAVVYLAMTPKSYPKRAIFRYLGEVAQEFVQEVTNTCHGGDWRQAVATVGRPYAYIQFDRRLQAKRTTPAAQTAATSKPISAFHRLSRIGWCSTTSSRPSACQ